MPKNALVILDPNAMTKAEFATLDGLERKIETAWDQAALALARIKADKLYRTSRTGDPQTWNEYCKRVHDMTPQWANSLIKRAKAVQEVNSKSETAVSLSKAEAGALVNPPKAMFGAPTKQELALDRQLDAEVPETAPAPKTTVEIVIFTDEPKPFEAALANPVVSHGNVKVVVDKSELETTLTKLASILATVAFRRVSIQ